MNGTGGSFVTGDHVRVTGVPADVETMPDETRRLFARIVGRVLRVDDVNEWGDLVLNVRDDGSQAPNCDEHTLWLSPAFAELVTPIDRQYPKP
jgi:hypothetical protein